MTLKEQLRQMFEGENFLPDDPEMAISGTELIDRARSKLQGDYKDTAVRSTIATLAAEPTSPIARRVGSQGYYRRLPAQQVISIDAPVADANATEIDIEQATSRSFQLEEKFRAFYLRYAALNDRFPVHIEHTAARRRSQGVNKWKFPDVIVLDWDAKASSETGVILDQAMLEVKRGLGEQPFHLSSLELKVDLSLASFREYFFQCVSNSMWAHSACLVIACSITDSLLEDELRRLGTSYGVSISTFGFSRDELAALPDATVILSMEDDSFEKLFENRSENALASGNNRRSLDWDHIKDLKIQSSEFSSVFDWVAKCLQDRKPYSFKDYKAIQQIQDRAV